MRSLLHGAAATVAGALMALLGTVWFHQVLGVGGARLPVGIVLGALGVLAVSVAMRAWAGMGGVVGAVVGAFLATQLAAQMGPGGDVLIQGDILGYTWLILAPVMGVVAAFAPRQWFVAP
jgi:hypothetical protein